MGIAELTRNAVDVLPEGELATKLKLGRPLRVKLGIDVTSPDIHLGRGIPLQRLRAFQDEGHRAVLIIGDYTTRIGDPSGRSSERPILSDAEIDANAERYLVDMARHKEIDLSAQKSQWIVHVAHENLLPDGRMGLLRRLRFRLFVLLRLVSRPSYYGYGLGDEVRLSAEIIPVRVR